MGGNLQKNSQKNNESQLKIQQSDQHQIFYQELSNQPPTFGFDEDSYNIFDVQRRTYISFYNKHLNELKIFDAQTAKIYRFKFQGQLIKTNICIAQNKLLILILTNQRFYQLQIIVNQLKILRQYYSKEMEWYQGHQLQCWKKFMLVSNNHQVYLIREGLHNRQKILNKILIHSYTPYYQIQNGVLIYGHHQQFIQTFDIISKQQKQVKIKCPGSKFNEIQIKFIQLKNDHIDVVFYIQCKGLFLNKINYHSGLIENYKFIYYDVSHYRLFQENDLVAFQTQNYFMTFDKDYNIIQKFEINSDYQMQWSQQLSKQWNSNTLINIHKTEQLLILVINCSQYQKLRLFKQKMRLKKGNVWLNNVQNYQVELKDYIGFEQISQNQHYVTIRYNYSLILYRIEQKIEQQYFFDQEIRFVNLSDNSRYFYVGFNDRVICYEFLQDLKLINQWFYKNQNTVKEIFVSSSILMINYYSDVVRLITKKGRKLIFKLNKIKGKSYSSQNEIYLMSNSEEVLIYKLSDRKQFLKFRINNIDCRIINEQDLLILKENGQLELWNFSDAFKGVIMNNIYNIKSRNSNIFQLETQKETILLDSRSLQILKLQSRISNWNPIIITQKYNILLKSSIINNYHEKMFSLVCQTKQQKQ